MRISDWSSDVCSSDLGLLAAPLDGLADEHLIGVRAVHVGGVEQVEAALQRVVDGGDRFGVVVRTVERAHAHAAEAEGGDAGGGEIGSASWRERVCQYV